MIKPALVPLFLALSLPANGETLTAARVVRANAIIGPNDVAISSVNIAGALGAGTEIVGLEARVTLYPGRPIMPEHVGPAALVDRNQVVTLLYRSGGLSIATEARALARGGVGDTIRVMNLSSRNTVIGRVREDGKVQVFIEGSSR